MTRKHPVRVVPSTVVAAGDGVVRNIPGNAYDKHGSRNPIVSNLMRRFHQGVTDALRLLEPDSLLDVGCGEGRTTEIINDSLTCPVVGLDLEEVVVREASDNIEPVSFLAGSAFSLPFADHSFDVVVATEMLEHLDRPAVALEELIRVARRAVVVTVPHEPWFRIANVLRARYLADLGNTPGHVQHWSRSSFGRELTAHAGDASVEPVGLWLMGIVRV